MKRLSKLTHAVRQHSWIEMKKARGFETPGEFEISPNTKIPAPQSIHKMRAPAAVREVLALQQNASRPADADDGRMPSIGIGCRHGEHPTGEVGNRDGAQSAGERLCKR